MKKDYQELLIGIVSLEDEIVRTSAGQDPFDDNWSDGNLF